MQAPTIVCSALVMAWVGSVGIARAETPTVQDAPKDAPTLANNPPPIAPPTPPLMAKPIMAAVELTPLPVTTLAA